MFVFERKILLYIAIMGHGVVGSGVAEVISRNNDLIVKRNNLDSLEVKHILDLRDFPELSYSSKFTKNFDDILNDDDVKIVVETMGGLNPAYKFVKACLEKGKSVVTSNKELVAAHGAELLKIAKDKGINYLFEASVGGGIPIIRPLNQCLAANEISSVKGILNGTTNYILTKMFKEGTDFEKALADAQAKGYAERNPAADVEGHDACRKIAILSSLVYGKKVNYEKINTQGICDVSNTDVAYAEKINSVIKLIGSAYIEDGKVYASVEPSILSNDHPLSGIEDVFNGILVNGNAIGDVMFYGRGAGKLPTASAVVADVIDSVRNLDRNNRYFWEESEGEFIADYEEITASFLIRIKGASDKIKGVFDDAEIITVKDGEFAVITPEMKIKDLNKIIADLDVIKKIRICK